ncbi:MAG: hypothetical protein M3N52_11830 [Actinomycetota bacterium]|nr:hypothetical protein [Actinomycetota bacterium]
MTEPRTVQQMMDSVTRAANELATEVRADRLQRHRENRWIIALLVVLGLLVAGVSTIAVSNRTVTQRIESCTTAGGECYEHNRKRSRQVVTDIARMNIYIHRCMWAHKQATDAQIEQCVAEKMAAATPPPPR